MPQQSLICAGLSQTAFQLRDRLGYLDPGQIGRDLADNFGNEVFKSCGVPVDALDANPEFIGGPELIEAALQGLHKIGHFNRLDLAFHSQRLHGFLPQRLPTSHLLFGFGLFLPGCFQGFFEIPQLFLQSQTLGLLPLQALNPVFGQLHQGREAFSNDFRCVNCRRQFFKQKAAQLLAVRLATLQLSMRLVHFRHLESERLESTEPGLHFPRG